MMEYYSIHGDHGVSVALKKIEDLENSINNIIHRLEIIESKLRKEE